MRVRKVIFRTLSGELAAGNHSCKAILNYLSAYFFLIIFLFEYYDNV